MPTQVYCNPSAVVDPTARGSFSEHACPIAMGDAVPPGFEVRHVNRSTWVTPVYYANLAPVGAGAFGTVCSATDLRTGAQVRLPSLLPPPSSPPTYTHHIFYTLECTHYSF